MSSERPPDSNPMMIHFAGWGKTQKIDDLKISSQPVEHLDQNERHFLGKWKATAICGNDITSSCLYVSGLAIATAGVMAPFALILVSFTLFLFRKIYAEVGSALPLNGGTYTLLLNTTTKKKAAMAAALTILSYIATAVISANEAIHYLHTVIPLPVAEATIGLLATFALLSLIGVSESASVALIIFIIHLVTLTTLAVSASYLSLTDLSILKDNFLTAQTNSSWAEQLLRGFLVGLLGISGFESSANYIEEQKPGVFPKTLRNMWIAVSVFNPLLCFLALALFSIPFISENQTSLLASMAESSAGSTLAKWVAIDAFLVLSGAILTSFVGIIGLIRRMTLDRCLPQILLSENNWRKTNHWIILAFFAVCVSVFILTEGKIESLAAVYTISFLAVMLLFGVGNMLLKVRRGKLPRSERATWPVVVMACVLVSVGLIGNLFLNQQGTKIFLGYYLGAVGLVMLMLLRTPILRFVLQATQASEKLLPGTRLFVRKFIERVLQPITSVGVIYFTKGDDIALLNHAALYVLRNEQTHNLKIVRFYNDGEEIDPSLWHNTKTIDQMYPQLSIDLILVKGEFAPSSIQALSERLQVSKNRMFIGTPGDSFPHRVEKLGGVRVIL